jgi:hypothetical protein
VPKYFFHVTDGTNSFRDREGTVFANDAHAVSAAEEVAADLREENGFEDFYVDLRDANDTQLAKVHIHPRH